MHDRENSGPFIERAFQGAIVWKQADYAGIAPENFRPARTYQRIDLAARQERRERRTASILLDRDRPQQGGCMWPAVRAGIFDGTLHPADGLKVNPELMDEVPAQPDRCGLRVERNTDPTTLQILGSANARAFVDEYVTMAEDTRRKYRQGDERAVAGAVEADEFGCGKFRDIEFPAAHHAVEDVAAGFERNAGEVDAGNPHRALAQSLHAIVATARKSQPQTRHRWLNRNAIGPNGVRTDARLRQPGYRPGPRAMNITAWRTGSCGGPWPSRTSCARPRANRE